MTSTPLPERICHSLMQAGILGPDGELPKCLGEKCNQYEECLCRQVQADVLLEYFRTANPAQVRKDVIRSFRGGSK